MTDTMSDGARLPKSVMPRRYDLLVAPDLETFEFGGTVSIDLDVSAPADTVVLHAEGLDVELESLVSDGAPVAATLLAEPERYRVVVRAERPLAAGAATVTLRFRGVISDGLLGFYRSTFTDDDGNKRVIAATQFEAPHARKAFPCFDEPEFKAVFAITLEVADGLLALSNGPETAREQLADGRVRVTFADTIPMSTYLVAWVVGPLELTSPVDAGGVAVRVAHVPGRAHLTQFPLDVGAFAIRFFADYYGIPYPGDKCDLVALPDFSFGAMENLGCVTFRETRLLVDPDDATLDEMTAAALTIVHEIAHMWFGDLVTMKWWNGIWLNEAFATFMEHLGLDAYRPAWTVWEDFATGRALALDTDALHSTRTVEYEVVTPGDADGMFDALTYEKGGAVLRMLERWLGHDAFRAGVRLYLERYQLANTETTDLWDALEDATGEPVRRLMDSWIFQPGFPVLRPDGGDVVQQRFSYDHAADDTRWVVPVLARVHHDGAAASRTLLIDGARTALDVPDDALVVLNAGGEGFYRVAYPPPWRDRLLDAGVLEPLERFALVDDLWASVLAGETTAAEFLRVVRGFGGERSLVVWRALSTHVKAAGRLVEGEARAALARQVNDLAAAAMDAMGWERRSDDDDRARQLRGLLIALRGGLCADPETIARSREIESHGGDDPDVESAAITVVASVGGDDDFESFVARMATSETPQEHMRYLFALAEFPDEQLVLKACHLAMTDAVRPQNAPFVLQRALRNREHGAAAWSFVRDEWDVIRRRFSRSLVPRIIAGTTWLVEGTTPDDVTAFVAAHPLDSGQRTIDQYMEQLSVHRATMQRERGPFAASLLTP